MAINATLARRWFREVWIDGGDKTVDELLAPDASGWMEGGFISGPAEFKAARAGLLTALPDMAITVEDVIEQDDKVVVRWRGTGTHLGNGLGLAPTNRAVAFRGMTWIEFRNGQIVRGWDSWNLGGLIASLAAPDGQAAQ